jgi:hypothetical protein
MLTIHSIMPDLGRDSHAREIGKIPQRLLEPFHDEPKGTAPRERVGIGRSVLPASVFRGNRITVISIAEWHPCARLLEAPVISAAAGATRLSAGNDATNAPLQGMGDVPFLRRAILRY